MRKCITLLFLSCFLLLNLSVSAQERSVRGKVTSSDDGSPLPGVSIKITGTTLGTTTDADGNFTVKVTSTAPSLTVSFIGYVTKVIPLDGKTVVDISLVADSEQLQEVVITTALGITRQQKGLGYAAQSVNSKELNFNHQPNLINALQGKVAGATISSTGGGPGQGANIRIRGVNSIDPNVSGDPLYVIDGVQIDNTTSSMGATVSGSSSYNVRTVGNRASDINPADIETINILKGGAATALYGLRGANGVVVITTKRGKGTGLSVNFSNSYGIDVINKTPAVQTEYTSGVLGVYNNNGALGIGPAWGPTIAEAKLLDPSHPDKLFDNYKQAFDTGSQLNNSLSVAGGTENVKFYSSISSLVQEGMMPNTNYKNFSGRLNTDVTISPKFKAGVNMNFTNSGGYKYSADRYGEGLAYWSPIYDVQDYLNEDGTQKYIGTNNPIYGAATNRLKDNVNRFIGGVNLTYQPTEWLSLSYRGGIDTYADNRLRTAPGPMGIPNERTYDNGLGSVGEYNSNFRALNSTFVASLSSKITDDLKGTLRVGHELYNRRLKDVGVLGSELSIYNFFNLGNAKILGSTHSLTEKRLNGTFGEATLEYKNYLFLTVTGRNDITSTLAKDNRSFFYPSASLSYVFSDHFELPDFINQSKLRLSYAKIGKDAQPYATSFGFSNYSNLPTGNTGLTMSANLGNPNLRPEFTNTYEAGLEMSLLNNRLGFDFTYYNSLSEDQIVQAQISSATGYVTTSVNAGDIRNKGIELVLNGTPIKTKDFTWNASLNFSANRNKVLTMPNNIEEIVYGGARGYGNAAVSMKIIAGEAYGNIYGSYWERYGADPNDTKADKSLPLLIGADGFPVISGSKQKLLGNSQPDWIGGITNTFIYKGLSLTTLFDARVGFEKYDWLENFYSAFGLPDYSVDRRSFKVFEGFLADGTPNTKQVWLGQKLGPDGVDYGEGYYRRFYRNISEPFVQDASWVRLRSASLSYSLPAKLLPSKVIRNATVSVTGNNLLLFTNYYGLDPESSSYDSGSNNDGSAGFTYPAARTFMFTLNVGF